MGDLDDDVGGETGTGWRGLDRLRRRSLVEAVGLPLVGRKKRIQPANALLGIEPIDSIGGLQAGLQFFGIVSFDHEYRHGGLLFAGFRSTLSHSRFIVGSGSTRGCAALCRIRRFHGTVTSS